MYGNKTALCFDSLEALLMNFSDLFINKIEEIKGVKAELLPGKDYSSMFSKSGTVTSTDKLRAAITGAL